MQTVNPNQAIFNHNMETLLKSWICCNCNHTLTDDNLVMEFNGILHFYCDNCKRYSWIAELNGNVISETIYEVTLVQEILRYLKKVKRSQQLKIVKPNGKELFPVSMMEYV